MESERANKMIEKHLKSLYGKKYTFDQKLNYVKYVERKKNLLSPETKKAVDGIYADAISQEGDNILKEEISTRYGWPSSEQRERFETDKKVRAAEKYVKASKIYEKQSNLERALDLADCARRVGSDELWLNGRKMEHYVYTDQQINDSGHYETYTFYAHRIFQEAQELEKKLREANK
jgi:hypothetical protein